MTKIFKYPVTIGDFTLELPQNAQILTVQIQNREPFMWIEINPELPTKKRYFAVHGTGHDIPDATEKKYIGTFQDAEGILIWHLFEILK